MDQNYGEELLERNVLLATCILGDLPLLLGGITSVEEERNEEATQSPETGSTDRSVVQQSHYLLQPFKHKVNCVRALE